MRKEYEAPEAKRLRFELTDALMDDSDLGEKPTGSAGGGLNPPYNLVNSQDNGYQLH